VGDGGYVQSSHVQIQQAGASEADLLLKLPSEKVGAALAALERVASVRDESQSLQDITSSYDAARRRLADATAERAALLRALSRASTQGQIDSLHERLAQASSAIGQARSALQAVSRRASTAEVEVTIVGDAHASGEGLTLTRGLHDAGRVLLVTLIVLLIAAAALVPASLLFVALVTAGRAWRRSRREHALDAS
jgi:flagellar biosynthesis chaperone FliJ